MINIPNFIQYDLKIKQGFFSLRRAIYMVIFSVFITLATGCSTLTNPTTNRTSLSDSKQIQTAKSYDVFVDEFPEVEARYLLNYAHQDVFKIGDTATISVFNVDSLSGDHIVDRAGEIAFPLIGKIKVAGLNTLELQAQLVQEYGIKYLQNPSISVKLDAQKLGRIVVDGAVDSPGVFDVYKAVSLSEAIALAGGLTIDANKKAVFLVREYGGERKVKSVNIDDIRKLGAPDPKIYPNDIVFVQESGGRIALREILRTIPLINTAFILATR